MSTVPTAIVSIGALFPGAPTTPEFWRDLVEGRDRLTDVPRTHWLPRDYFDPRPGTPDKAYATRGGFLSGVDFAPAEFGLPPSTLPAIDTAQLLALVVARRVLDEATRGRHQSLDRSRISVLLGVASATELVAHMAGRLQIPVVEAAMKAAGIDSAAASRVRAGLEACYVPWQEGTFPGLLGNVVAGRIANRLDLGGTNAVLDAACASSLAAVSMAVQELSLGTADLVITGGVDTLNDILMFMCFAQTGALSRSGDCRPFSRDADGTMLGEGIGLFALRRLEDAERDGDPIYAVIRGIGTSSDGRATSIYAPLAAGQVRALERAYAMAGVSPATIGLVEAHGTGTVAGDRTELQALTEIYRSGGARPHRTAIGSVKGQIGHTKAAAGAAGLAKAALALHHRVLPPTIKVGAPLPEFAEATCPFHPNTTVRPWIQGAGHPRRAAVSALGFGGTNFHLVLEEHRGPSTRCPRLRALPSELVTLGAEDPASLAKRCREAAVQLSGPGALVHLARSSQQTFRASSPVRLALVASSEEALADSLRRAALSLESGSSTRDLERAGCFLGEGEPAGPVAFLFPGQGSQSVGMTSDLAVHFDEARRIWDEAARFEVFAGEGLHDRVFPPAAFSDEGRAAQSDRLKETEWAQPALACASLSMLGLVQRLGLVPVAVGGHSLGEVTALAAGGVLGPADAVRVARARGTFMSEASRGLRGAMVSALAGRDRVASLLSGWRIPLVVANHNAPDQVVLSGPADAVTDAEQRLQEAGIATQRLPVATAFHSPMVEGAHAPFREWLTRVPVSGVKVPIFSSASAAPYPDDAGAVRDQLSAAVSRPVCFVEQIDAMYAAGARTFLEVGPGNVLTRLIARCLAGRPHLAVAMDQPGNHGVTAMWMALGRLSAAGIPLDFAPLWENQALPEVPAPAPASSLRVRIHGANFGKPYPEREQEVLAVARPPATAGQPPSAPAPEVQRDFHAPLIAAQAEYERAMAESHTAFLRTMEASYAALGASSDRLPLPVPGSPAAEEPAAVMSRPPSPAPRSPQAPAPAAAVRTEAPAQTSSGSAAPVDLTALVLSVVAEKTGYPVEMIKPDMDLEADLGIDSIKRVEILAATRTRLPSLPSIQPAQLGKLRTLAEVVRHLGSPPVTPAAAQEARAPTPKAPAGVSRFVTELVSSAAIDLATPGLLGASSVAIIPDDGGVAECLARRLGEHGIAARVTAVAPADARAVIFLGGLNRVSRREDALAVNGQAFDAARIFARRAMEGGGLFVTVQDTGGDFGSTGSSGDRAWLSGLCALAKTAAAEWPTSCARAIDIERGGRGPEEIAGAITRELLTGGSELEVALSAGGARRGVRVVAAPLLAQGERILKAGDVVLVSGGARGITAACLLALGAAVKPRFVIVGRTGLAEEPAPFRGLDGDAQLKRAALEWARETGGSTSPRDVAGEVRRVLAMRETRATLARLAELGVEARYEAMDVRDAGALSALVDDVRGRWGAVRGLVHGAGVLADALLEHRADRGDFDRVLDTKIGGLAALLQATGAEPLAWICLFSSIAARTGNAGQSDYAMANAVLNSVAAVEARRRGPDARVVSLGWGPWEGGMVTPELARHFASRGVSLIPVDAGAAAFVRECEASFGTTGEAAVEVLLGSGLAPDRSPQGGELRIDAASMPFLDDHRVRGAVVLPLALAVEWLARVAAPVDGGPVVLRSVHVQRGLLLPDFERAGVRVRASASSHPDGVVLELRDDRGAARFTAQADAPAAGPFRPPGARPGPRLPGPLYGPERLFHGPRFQVLSELHAVSPEGGHATLTGTAGMGWPGGPWRVDPAGIDGALQLALLSSVAAGMGPTLPLAIDRVVAYPPSTGMIRCVLETRERTPERAVFDAWLTAADGAPVAELRGIEMFLAPGGTAAA